MNSKELVDAVANGTDLPVRSTLGATYKRRSNWHQNVGLSVDVPVYTKQKMLPSRTDQSYNRPMSMVVEEFKLAGRTLADIRSAQYDFADGKDDGRKILLSQRKHVEAEDVYQEQLAVGEYLRSKAKKAVKRDDLPSEPDISNQKSSESVQKSAEGAEPEKTGTQ